nr:uncharacterized protein LOC109154045 [Ipomoea batatas]
MGSRQRNCDDGLIELQSDVETFSLVNEIEMYNAIEVWVVIGDWQNGESEEDDGCEWASNEDSDEVYSTDSNDAVLDDIEFERNVDLGAEFAGIEESDRQAKCFKVQQNVNVPFQVPQVPEPSIQNMLEVETPADDESWLTNLDIDGIVAHILTQPMQVAEQIPLTSQPPRDEEDGTQPIQASN